MEDLNLEIQITSNGYITEIILSKPKVNTMDIRFLEELRYKMGIVSKKEYGIVLIKSYSPDFFSSGLDLSSFYVKEDIVKTKANINKSIELVMDINRIILSSNCIFIAQISGPVIGCAASITFAWDFRIASENAWFWISDSQYGGLLADGGIELLCQLIGKGRAMELLMTNRKVYAKEALNWGLVNKISKKNELNNDCSKFVTNLSRLSIYTLAATKALINHSILLSYNEIIISDVFNGETMKRLEKFAAKD